MLPSPWVASSGGLKRSERVGDHHPDVGCWSCGWKWCFWAPGCLPAWHIAKNPGASQASRSWSSLIAKWLWQIWKSMWLSSAKLPRCYFTPAWQWWAMQKPTKILSGLGCSNPGCLTGYHSHRMSSRKGFRRLRVRNSFWKWHISILKLNFTSMTQSWFLTPDGKNSQT